MYNVYVPLKLKQHLEYDRPFQSSELFLSLQNKAKCKAFLVKILFHGTKETFFNINSITLSLPLKQMLGATLKGQGYSPIKVTGVLVVPVRGLNLWIGFKKSLRRKCLKLFLLPIEICSASFMLLLLNWYLLGVKMNLGHAHETRFWYILQSSMLRPVGLPMRPDFTQW